MRAGRGEVVRPCQAAGRRKRGNALRRPLGHMALDRSEPVDLAWSRPAPRAGRREARRPVGIVGSPIPAASTLRLAQAARRGCDDQAASSIPKPGSTLRASRRRALQDARHRASRVRCRPAGPGDSRSTRRKIRSRRRAPRPRAKEVAGKGRSQDVRTTRFRSSRWPIGSAKYESPGRRFLRHEGADRLEGMAEGLIEPQGDILPETPGHRRTRHGRQLADALDPETVERVEGRQGESASASTGRIATVIDRPARRDDPVVAITRHRPGRPGAIGDSGSRRDALGAQARERGRRSMLSSPPREMRRAGNVDPDAVGRIGGDDRRIAKAPQSQPHEARRVLLRRRVREHGASAPCA